MPAAKGTKQNPFHAVQDLETLFAQEEGAIVHIDLLSFDVRREAPSDSKNRRLVGLHVPDFQRFLVTTHGIIRGGEKFRESRQGTGELVLFAGDADHKKGAYIKDALQRVYYKRLALDSQDELSPTLPFVVTHSSDWKDCAREFLGINKGRTSVSSFEQYRAGLISELEEDLILRDLVAANGYQIVRTVPGNELTTNKIAAFAGLRDSIIRQINAEAEDPGQYADRALRVLSAAVPLQQLDGRFLAGFVEYLEQTPIKKTGKTISKPLSKTITDDYLVMAFKVVYGGSLGTVTTAFAKFQWRNQGSSNGTRGQYRLMFDKAFGTASRKPNVNKAMTEAVEEYATDAFSDTEDEDYDTEDTDE